MTAKRRSSVSAKIGGLNRLFARVFVPLLRKLPTDAVFFVRISWLGRILASILPRTPPAPYCHMRSPHDHCGLTSQIICFIPEILGDRACGARRVCARNKADADRLAHQRLAAPARILAPCAARSCGATGGLPARRCCQARLHQRFLALDTTGYGNLVTPRAALIPRAAKPARKQMVRGQRSMEPPNRGLFLYGIAASEQRFRGRNNPVARPPSTMKCVSRQQLGNASGRLRRGHAASAAGGSAGRRTLGVAGPIPHMYSQFTSGCTEAFHQILRSLKASCGGVKPVSIDHRQCLHSLYSDVRGLLSSSC